MHEIRSDAVRRRERETGASAPGKRDGPEAQALSLPHLADTAEEFAAQRSYSVGDFLCFHGEDFIRNAYRALLGRDPDPGGFAAFDQQLRCGTRARIEILGRLRYSAEGRARAVVVRGLGVPFAIATVGRVPLLGRVLRIAQALVTLPDSLRAYERHQAAIIRDRNEASRRFNALGIPIATELERLRRSTATQIQMDEVKGQIDRLTTRFGQPPIADRPDAPDSRVARDEQDVTARVTALAKAMQSKADGEQLTHLANHLVNLVLQRVERSVFEAHVEAVRATHVDLRVAADDVLNRLRNVENELRALSADLAIRVRHVESLIAIDSTPSRTDSIAQLAQQLEVDAMALHKQLNGLIRPAALQGRREAESVPERGLREVSVMLDELPKPGRMGAGSGAALALPGHQTCQP